MTQFSRKRGSWSRPSSSTGRFGKRADKASAYSSLYQVLVTFTKSLAPVLPFVTESIYRSAETVEFCSAQVSHQLAAANPENLVLCPFAISVYVLAADPDRVRLTYRRPFLLDEQSRPAVEAMMTLVEGIVADATAW